MKDLMQRRTDRGIVHGWCLVGWTLVWTAINLYLNAWWATAMCFFSALAAAYLLRTHYRVRRRLEEIRRIHRGIQSDLYEQTKRWRN